LKINKRKNKAGVLEKADQKWMVEEFLKDT
jgi:hypothetical protein